MLHMNNKDTVYIMCECLVPKEYQSVEIIQESAVDTSSGRKKCVTIDTCLQSFEVKNWNGRIYGKDVVMDAIDNDGMIQNDIKHGQWVGEYGHPQDTDPKRQVVFDPARCSHRILNYRTEGNLLKAHVQTLAGGQGDILCNRILQGVEASFSLRSLGSVDLQTRRVKAPLKVITYDSVFRPSHIEAYQDTILAECAGLDGSAILNESVLFVPINESLDQISAYLGEKSDNVKKVAEMFNLDKLNMVLAENGRVNLRIDDETIISVPVETAIGLQYADILGSGKLVRR